jgi:hypothetical protein
MDLETYVQIMAHPITLPLWAGITAINAYKSYEKFMNDKPQKLVAMAICFTSAHVGGSAYNLLEYLTK